MELTEAEIKAALGDAINPPRPRALAPIAYVRYTRDLTVTMLDAERAAVIVAKWGWQYKRRGPRPSRPPSTDPDVIREALNERLPADLSVSEVNDLGERVEIVVERRNIDA